MLFGKSTKDFAAIIWRQVTSLQTDLLGYFWPIDAADLVWKCEQCQKYTNIQWRLMIELGPIIAPCLFAMWEIDILRSFFDGDRSEKIFYHRCQLFYEVDGGQTPYTNNRAKGQGFHVEVDNLSLWPIEGDHHWQWSIVRQPKAQEILLSTLYRILVDFGRSSSI